MGRMDLHFTFMPDKNGVILTGREKGMDTVFYYINLFHEHEGLNFDTAIIRGGIHGGSKSSESRSHVTVVFKREGTGAIHRSAHIVITNGQLDLRASELFGWTDDFWDARGIQVTY